MTYGVRFCGGCNPRYDRKAALERICEALSEKIAFTYAAEGVFYDGLLVLGGCPNCCADYSRFQFRQPVVSMWDPGQEAAVLEMLERRAE